MTHRSAPIAGLFALVAVAGLVGACTSRAVTGTGPVTTETRAAAPFTKLEVSYGIVVDLQVGEQPAVAVEAPADLLPIISTEISGDKLRIRGTTDLDRKSTRLNSSHLGISYAVFCLKK